MGVVARAVLVTGAAALVSCAPPPSSSNSGGEAAPQPVTTEEGEWLVTCHGPAFPGSRLTALPGETGAPEPPKAAEQALVEEIEQRSDPELAGAADAGELRVLAVADDAVEYAWVHDTSEYQQHDEMVRTIVFEADDGEWRSTLGGDCPAATPELYGETRPANFHVTDAELHAKATEVTVEVIEIGCSGGRDIDGLIEGPYVEERDGQLRVLYGVEPLDTSGSVTCEGNPPTPTTLELDEPLGDRELVDASRWPLEPVDPGGGH